jgi:hypothetical protein
VHVPDATSEEGDTDEHGSDERNHLPVTSSSTGSGDLDFVKQITIYPPRLPANVEVLASLVVDPGVPSRVV